MGLYDDKMTELADAVRAKSGATGKLTVDQMTAAVNGITSGGGEGGGDTDTSDATVTADKLLKGVTAYGAKGKVTGEIETVTPTLTDNVFTVPSGFIEEPQTLTVPEIPPLSVHLNGVSIGPGYNPESKSIKVGKIANITEVTPGTSDVVIPADTYIAGDLTVHGDPNLTPENIKKGVSIFGVEGTFAGGGDGAEFYKCASVNSSNKTWTGFKAVMADGVYTFEQTETTGLVFGGGFTPAVDKIYNAEATVAVSGLWTGTDPSLVFYAPLSGSAGTAETGQSLNVDGEVAFQTVEGVPCAFFNGESQITASTDGMPQGNEPVTVCAWVRAAEEVWDLSAVLGMGTRSHNQLFSFALLPDGRVSIGRYADDSESPYDSINHTAWNHVCITHDCSTDRIYINGNEVSSFGHENNVGSWKIFMGGNGDNAENLNGYIADARIYNRALSAEEVYALYAAGTR